MNRMIAVIALCLTVLACAKKEAPTTADTAQPSAAPAAPPPPAHVAAAPPAIDVDSLPVEEDFEADAEKELTVANLSAKLDDLDKEISAP